MLRHQASHERDLLGTLKTTTLQVKNYR
jgi:hypothetical protein